MIVVREKHQILSFEKLEPIFLAIYLGNGNYLIILKYKSVFKLMT